ncbi:MAG: tetratricopeptide repeat protein [Acidobacteriota bacterium]|nr:tetratricopeptide repeat protein [Acidobacteriota bacterium]
MTNLFLSYASQDKDLAHKLRNLLQDHLLTVWLDDHRLNPGDNLKKSLEEGIDNAEAVLVLFSLHTLNSEWCCLEVKKAVELEKPVIPLRLPGIGVFAVKNYMGYEPVTPELDPKHMEPVVNRILSALGKTTTMPVQPSAPVPETPISELELSFREPKLTLAEGKTNLTARATVTWKPPEGEPVYGYEFNFVAPIGKLEIDELRWYLERYYIWPAGLSRDRARRLENQLPNWGRALMKTMLDRDESREAHTAWENDEGERRVSIHVVHQEKNTEEAQAAGALFALPWELLHDDRGYLFQSADRVRVRRRLPNRKRKPPSPAGLPIRILLLSPRPEDAGYIDHRASALPLVEAQEQLGSLVDLTVLHPPTFPALKEALQRAHKAGNPFHVVHFDGHGVYNPNDGLGALVFEHPKDSDKFDERTGQLIDAEKLGAELKGYSLPLVFLEACQTSMSKDDVSGSVAAQLLKSGVTSVVAMTHSVLVATAAKFVASFYQSLAQGDRVGAAMLEGQHALFDDTFRIKIMGAGDLNLQDWFVPVLYQETADPQLFKTIPDEQVKKLTAQRQKARLGELAEPPHGFQGRSRELLYLERLLQKQTYAVVIGQGGAGKTALTSELARWLVRSQRFDRGTFVSVEAYGDARKALDALGRQLIPDYTVALYSTMDEALQPVTQILAERPTVVVFDNLESILPKPGEEDPIASETTGELLALAERLAEANPKGRLLFTSRERLPEPFSGNNLTLGALAVDDAVALVGKVLAKKSLAPKADDAGDAEAQMKQLAEALNGHARALVLLAPELARRGVTQTLAELTPILAELEQQNEGDRENSLFASLALSLNRLPPEVQKAIQPLAVFHGGAHMFVMSQVLEVETEAARVLCIALIEVGLAQDMGRGHLRLDPALPTYLAATMDPESYQAAAARWTAAMEALVGFLYQQKDNDTQLVNDLTRLELANLTALLDRVAAEGPPERVVGLAQKMERLLAELGQPRALARAVAARETASQHLPEWGKARFQAESSHIDRLLEAGRLPEALKTAQALLAACQRVGDDAYLGAAYDHAMAWIMLGRVLTRGGRSEQALTPLAEARTRFIILAQAGNASAERMASVALSESAGCLFLLGQLDEAAAAYEENIELAKAKDWKRDQASDLGNLGTVRKNQGRYGESLDALTQARDLFEALNEPRQVAITWHQIGVTYQQVNQYEQADRAYRQALALRIKEGDRGGESTTLNQLANLHNLTGRLDEAVSFYRKAAEIYVMIQGQAKEGAVRNNLADTLIKLKRFDEARIELERAIECGKPFGHAPEPWKTWYNLHNLEKAVGRAEAAAQAREKAKDLFRAYRRDGGENHNPGGRLCLAAAQALQAGQTDELLAQLEGMEVPDWARTFSDSLIAILKGSRDPTLAVNPDLYYQHAVELEILLAQLGG